MREWSYEDFGQFLDARMRAEGIRNDAELSRLSGVKQTQISNWRRGLARPALESLDKIATVLRIPSTVLYQLSGHLPEQELTELDTQVVPTEFRDLIDVYNEERLTDEDRAILRRSVGLFLAGFLIGLERQEPSPPAVKRGRGGRPAA